MEVLKFDESKVDPVSGDPIEIDSIPWPKRPGTSWEAVKASPYHSHLICKNCRGDYNRNHGSPKNHLLCNASEAEWEKFNRARALRHRDSMLALIKGDLMKLTDEQRGDLFHRLRDTFCLNCGARCEQKTCKCPNAERC